MTETSTPNSNDTNSSGSPGQILREKREKLNLSAQEVAKRVHLDIKIIEAIEADDYAVISTATYVRGYLRSYAKAVGADGDKIIELYDADSPAPPPDILPEVKQPSQISSSDKPVKAFTYLITLGLVLLLLIWYQSNFIVEPKLEEQNPVKRPDRINNTDTTYKIVVHPEGWQTPVYDTPEEPFETSEKQPETPKITTPTTPSSDKQKEENEQQDADNENMGILPVYDATTSSKTTGPDSIVLNINKDSWIEIYDSNDNRLLMDLAKAGEHYEINGTAPFNVKLGFSEGVELKFNGKLFDQEPYSHNGVARFKLPPE